MEHDGGEKEEGCQKRLLEVVFTAAAKKKPMNAAAKDEEDEDDFDASETQELERIPPEPKK